MSAAMVFVVVFATMIAWATSIMCDDNEKRN